MWIKWVHLCKVLKTGIFLIGKHVCLSFTFIRILWIKRSTIQGHSHLLLFTGIRSSVLTNSVAFVCCLVAKLCWTFCNPLDCSPSGSSVHGISQARILEWVVISPSRWFSRPRDQTRVSCLAGEFFTTEPPGKTLHLCDAVLFSSLVAFGPKVEKGKLSRRGDNVFKVFTVSISKERCMMRSKN